MRGKLLFVLAAVLLFSACAPYKMDIRQGNLIRPEQRERLRLGMSHNQVRALLGTPLVEDAFHPDRWDYVYYLEHARERGDDQRLTVYFQGDKLTRIDDSHMPALPPAAKEGAQPAAPEGAKP